MGLGCALAETSHRVRVKVRVRVSVRVGVVVRVRVRVRVRVTLGLGCALAETSHRDVAFLVSEFDDHDGFVATEPQDSSGEQQADVAGG